MKFSILPVSIVILLTLFFSSASATPYFSSSYLQLAQNKTQALNNAVQSIKQRTGGRVLSTKRITINGQLYYKIKVLLPSGKVQTFKIAAH